MLLPPRAHFPTARKHNNAWTLPLPDAIILLRIVPLPSRPYETCSDLLGTRPRTHRLSPVKCLSSTCDPCLELFVLRKQVETLSSLVNTFLRCTCLIIDIILPPASFRTLVRQLTCDLVFELRVPVTHPRETKDATTSIVPLTLLTLNNIDVATCPCVLLTPPIATLAVHIRGIPPFCLRQLSRLNVVRVACICALTLVIELLYFVPWVTLSVE